MKCISGFRRAAIIDLGNNRTGICGKVLGLLGFQLGALAVDLSTTAADISGFRTEQRVLSRESDSFLRLPTSHAIHIAFLATKLLSMPKPKAKAMLTYLNSSGKTQLTFGRLRLILASKAKPWRLLCPSI